MRQVAFMVDENLPNSMGLLLKLCCRPALGCGLAGNCRDPIPKRCKRHIPQAKLSTASLRKNRFGKDLILSLRNSM